MRERAESADLISWIAKVFEQPALLAMGHNQRLGDLNLGLGWLYYALGRIVRPQRAVVIGSFRGFVPLILGRAFQDNGDGGEVVFLDPSLVDGFWKDPVSVRGYFDGFGCGNVTHVLMTTQEFVTTEAYRGLGEIGMLFVDGYHTEEQARLDYRAFEGRLAPFGLALFHDSMVLRRSTIYGDNQAYQMTVKHFIDELRVDTTVQVLDLPFGTGLTLVRKLSQGPCEPLLEGRQERP